VAVWVGIIGLIGIAAEIGVVMIVYLDLAYKRRADEGRMHSMEDLIQTTVEAAMQRVRPIMMTGGSTIIGLLPIIW
jgi:Cu(I)/Ag(I) efflux system membrane protein CusA/SilA